MNSRFHRVLLGLLLAAAASALIPWAAQAQEPTERLVLKDGSYQSVVKYEMQGDRVHYLSSERYEWEDIPSSLIDWDATNKYNAELNTGKLRPKSLRPPKKKKLAKKRKPTRQKSRLA